MYRLTINRQCDMLKMLPEYNKIILKIQSANVETNSQKRKDGLKRVI